MPFPSKKHQFRPGKSGNPAGTKPRPTIAALDDLIARLDADKNLADVWFKESLGIKETVVERYDKKGAMTKTVTREQVPPNFQFFRLLVEYRNGKVPLPVQIQALIDDDSKPPRIVLPRPKGSARRSKAKRRAGKR